MLEVVLSFLMGVSKKRITELFSGNVPDQERSKQASHMSQIYFLEFVAAEGLTSKYYQSASKYRNLLWGQILKRPV